MTDVNLNALDQLLAADSRRQDGRFPWEHSQFGHDHFAAEEDVRELYDRLKIAQPVISWADSPASLWRAVSMLRTYANKHTLIGSLVPTGGGIEAAAMRAMLGAILNTDVMTSTGAAIKGMLGWINSREWRYAAIDDAADLIGKQEEAGHYQQAVATKSLVSRRARYHEAAVYPALYKDAPQRLTRNCFCFTPYARAVWLCMPPMVFKTDEAGYLHSDDGPAAEWSDGFQIFRNREEEERLAIEAAKPKQLTDGTEEKRPVGPTAMEMLREAMEEKRLRAAKPAELADGSDQSNGKH